MSKAGVRGRLLERGDADYEQARIGRIFNQRRPDRYPDAVLEALDAEDVAAGVRLAGERGWTVAVRSGGHSWAAWSVRDGGLLIDLAALDGLSYDEDSGQVAAGPAVKGGYQLAPFLQQRDRAFPGGHCPSVGIGGFLLQGGQGWNSRSKGWACESVAAIDVVTADGQIVRADAHTNPELLWAARGSGPGFPGIVTTFHLQTYPRPAAMWHDTWTFAFDDGAELLAWMHELLPRLDCRVEPVIAATRLPDVPLEEGIMRPGGTVLLLHSTVLADSDEEATRLLSPFGDGPLAGRALGHAQGPTSFSAENAAQARQNPDGYRYAVDCTWSNASAAQLAPPLLDLWASLDTEHSFSIWYGWAPSRPLPDMAFSVEGNVYVASYLIHSDQADDEYYRQLVHTKTAAVAAAGGGSGVGVYLGDTDFTRRNDRFLSEQNYRRLLDVTERWDPDGRFAGYLGSSAAKLNRRD